MTTNEHNTIQENTSKKDTLTLFFQRVYPYIKRIVLSPAKRILMTLLYNIQVFSFGIMSRIKRKYTPIDPKRQGYYFVILCIKKTTYAKLVITNINSLHYRNNAHHITVRCDKACHDYLVARWHKFDYPQHISLEIITEKADKGWQFFKVEEIIRAAQHDQILFDADTFWHEDIVIDREKITMLASCGTMAGDEKSAGVITHVFNKPEWLGWQHNVAAFVSIPQKYMYAEIADDMRRFNAMVWEHSLDFIREEKRGEIRRLSEEYAVNLSIQNNHPQDMLIVLKEEDGTKNKKKMESLYYGCKNEINE